MAANNETQVRITAETSQFQREVQRATVALKEFGASAASSFTGLGAGALAAGAIGTAFAAAAKNAINLADELSKMAQKTGVSIETLSALRVAGELSDVALEDLQAAFAKLANVMDASTVAGSEQATLFSRLGVNVKDASGHLRGTDDVLADIAERFKEMPDGALKTALAVQLFGESGSKLIPLLNGGKEGLAAFREEAEKLGVVISEAVGKGAEEFNDNLTRLKLASEGAGLQLADGLLPALKDVTEAIVAMSKSGEGFKGIGETLGAVLRGLAIAGAVAGAAFKYAGDALAVQAAAWSFVVKGEFSNAVAVVKAGFEDFGKTSENLIATIKALTGEHQDAAVKVVKAEVGKTDVLKGQAAAQAKIREDQLKSIQDATKAEIADQEKLRDAVRQAFETSLADARKFADEAKKLREQAAGKQADRNAQAEEKRASLLSEEEQQDRLKNKATAGAREAELLSAQATLKAFSGDVEGANRLAEQALKAAEQAAGFADRMADQSFGASMLERIGEVEAAAIETQAKVADAKSSASEERAKAQSATLDALNAKVAELQQLLAALPVKLDTTQAERQLEELKSRVANAGITVPATPPANIPNNAAGGLIRGPGTGTSDSILSWLSNGEFVVRATAVRQYGADFLHRLNAGVLPRFAAGGLVSSLRVPAVASAGRSALAPAVFNFPGLGSFPVSAKPDVMADLKAAFSREALRKGRRR